MKGKKVNSLFLCLGEVLVGILLLVKPMGFTAGIIIGAGVLMMLKGIKEIVGYFRASAEIAAQHDGLAGGLIALLIGGFCVIQYQWIMLAVPFLGMIYAILLLVLGIEKIQTAVDLRRMGHDKWWVAAVAAAISLVGAVVIYLNPFATAAYLWMFTGISLIVEAVTDAASMIMNR